MMIFAAHEVKNCTTSNYEYWVRHAIPTDSVPTDIIPTIHSRDVDVGWVTAVE